MTCTCGGPIQGRHEDDCDSVTGRNTAAAELDQTPRHNPDAAEPSVYVPTRDPWTRPGEAA